MYVFGSGKHKGHPRLIPPDLCEERDDRRLFIWSHVPYWMVVDAEFALFLKSLEGKATLDELLEANPGWSRHRKELSRSIRDLAAKGIISDGANPPASPHEDNNPRLIESITVNITRHCNLKCPFCYNGTEAPPISDEISADEVVRFLESIRGHLSDTAILMVLGGEPLIVPDKTLELARYGRKRKLRPLISTNGTMITEGFAREAKETGLEVQVSLDGHTPELSDQVRGSGSFERAMKGVRILVENGVHTILSMVCHSGNIQHLEDFYDFALEAGASEARFIPLKMMGTDGDGQFKPVKSTDLVRRAYSLFGGRPEYLRLAGRDWFSILATTCSMAYRRKSCGCGVETFLLDADGTIYPCLNTNNPEFRVANIRDDRFDFDRIWAGSRTLESVRNTTSVDTCSGPCAKCVVRHWCLGGCHGETHVNKGRLDSNAWNCADLRKATVEMMWVISERPDFVRRSDYIC